MLVIASKMGVARPGSIAVDGTKIKANASKHSALSWAHAEKIEAHLKQEIDMLLELTCFWLKQTKPTMERDQIALICRQKWRAGPTASLALPAQKPKSRKGRRNATRENWRHIPKNWQNVKPKQPRPEKKLTASPPRESVPGPLLGDQVNLTDEESRIMPTSGDGFDQCYNAQAAVDTKQWRTSQPLDTTPTADSLRRSLVDHSMRPLQHDTALPLVPPTLMILSATAP